MSVSRTVQRHEEPNLAVLNPLSDAISRASLNARNERAVVNDAVEYLPDRLGGSLHMRRSAVLRDGTLAGAAAHLAGGARSLWWSGVRLLSGRAWSQARTSVKHGI